MKKIIITLALLAALPCGMKAQTLVFWDGDNRFGVSAGTSFLLEKPTLSFSPTDVFGMSTSALFKQTEYSSKFTPTLGLFIGGERELSRNFTMGFSTFLNLGKSGYKTTYEGKGDTVYDYDVKNIMLRVSEVCNLGYFITDELELIGGIGVVGCIYIPNKSQETLLVNGVEKSTEDHADGFGSNFGFGVAGNVGINYYFAENFFLRGDIALHYYPFTSDGMKGDDDFFSTHIGNLVVKQNNLNTLDFSLTIGFLWD
ncbi:MAG: hypothetical protein SPJ13_05990 [Bacteroidales bacterium]|nr:hypothetical protein [Bacteroidales bacterium]